MTGTTTATLTLMSLQDIVNERPETFTAVLSPMSNGLLMGANDTATVNIVDNDGKYVLFAKYSFSYAFI